MLRQECDSLTERVDFEGDYQPMARLTHAYFLGERFTLTIESSDAHVDDVADIDIDDDTPGGDGGGDGYADGVASGADLPTCPTFVTGRIGVSIGSIARAATASAYSATAPAERLPNRRLICSSRQPRPIRPQRQQAATG